MSLQLVERGLERSGLPLEPCAWPFRSRLTVKLDGRAEAPDSRRGRTLSSSARGAQPPAHHGPFQRWLEDAPTSLLCARGIFSANRSWLLQRCNEPRKPTAGITATK